MSGFPLLVESRKPTRMSPLLSIRTATRVPFGKLGNFAAILDCPAGTSTLSDTGPLAAKVSGQVKIRRRQKSRALRQHLMLLVYHAGATGSSREDEIAALDEVSDRFELSLKDDR